MSQVLNDIELSKSWDIYTKKGACYEFIISNKEISWNLKTKNSAVKTGNGKAVEGQPFLNGKVTQAEEVDDCCCLCFGRSSKTSEINNNRVVPIREIVSITDHKKQKSDCKGFTLTYIAKCQRTFVWKRQSESFYDGDSSAWASGCEEIVTILQQRLALLPERPRHLLLFVNPVSGWNKGATINRKQVAPIFTQAGVKTQCVGTQYAGHAKDYVMDPGNDITQFDGIIGVGGDGTFTEIMNAFIIRHCRENNIDVQNDRHTDVPKLPIKLGIIPAGSAEGMVRIATNTEDIKTAVLHIIAGYTQAINTMSVYNGDQLLSFSTLISSYGLCADMFKDTEVHKTMGKIRYPIFLVKNLIKHRVFKAEISYTKAASTTLDGTYDEASNADTHQEGPNEVWKEVESFTMFKGVDILLLDSHTLGFTPKLRLLMIGADTKRLEHMSKLKPMEVLTTSLRDYHKTQKLRSGYVPAPMVEADCIKLKILNDPLESAEVDGGKCEEVMSIDGEPYILNHPEVYHRLHQGIIQMYGCGNVDRAKHINEYHTDKGKINFIAK